MVERTLARRYAKALFAIAEEKKIMDRLAAELSEFGQMAASMPDLSEFLAHPLIPSEQKLGVVKKIVPSIEQEPLLKNFLSLLVEKDRLGLLSFIAREFTRLFKKRSNIVEALVTTVFPLSPQEEAELVKALSEMTGKTVEISIRTDPGILGGLRIQIGDTVIDDSIITHLKEIRKDLIEH